VHPVPHRHAEDHWVVIQLNVTSTSYDDVVYSNVYVMTVRCENGKVAERAALSGGTPPASS
jgi:hypothetical protein